MKNRIEWVDVVKGLLILTVVLGHAIQEPLKVRGIGFEDNIWRNIIYSFHMPAFMAMSGYLVYRPKANGGGGIYDCFALIWKRLKQLIVPFMIWSIPLFIVYHNVDHIWDYILRPNKGYWFLWALFFIIVVYTLVDWACHKIRLKQEIAIGVVALVLIGGQMVLHNAKLLGYEYIAYYFIFYMMGYYANKYHDCFPTKSWVVWSVFCLWIAMAYFWTPNGLPFFLQGIPFVPSKLLQLGYRMLTPVVFIIWMYSAAPKMNLKENWTWQRLIELGQISLGIYVVHMVIKNLFAKLLLSSLPMMPVLFHVLIEFLVLTILSLATVRLIKRSRFLTKWLLGKTS